MVYFYRRHTSSRLVRIISLNLAVFSLILMLNQGSGVGAQELFKAEGLNQIFFPLLIVLFASFLFLPLGAVLWVDFKLTRFCYDFLLL